MAKSASFFCVLLLLPLLACGSSLIQQSGPKKRGKSSRSLDLVEENQAAPSKESDHIAKAGVKPSQASKVEDEGEQQVPDVLKVDADELAGQMRTLMEEIDKSTGKNGTMASAAISGAVADMVGEFDAMVLAKMKKAFGFTQAQITATVTKLEAQNAKTHKAKGVADTTNVNLGNCRENEQDLLQIYETCHNDATWANKTWDAACQAKEDAQFHDWSITKALAKKHKCDLSSSTCNQLEELKKHVDAHYKQATAKRDTYKAKTEDCDANEKIALAKEVECQGKLQSFLDKRADCDLLNFQLKVRMCAFGSTLQEKCNQYDELNKLLVKVKDGAEKTKFSEKYRKLQWKKAQTLKCQLNSYRGGGVTDDKTKAICESGVDYEKDIGVMNYMGDKVMGLMRPAPKEFACTETKLTIAGPKWTTSNESASYEKEDVFSENITLAPVGEGSFSWCQSNATRGNCRGFSCDAPLWKAKADQKTVKCTLTECSSYECCVPAAGAK